MDWLKMLVKERIAAEGYDLSEEEVDSIVQDIKDNTDLVQEAVLTVDGKLYEDYGMEEDDEECYDDD